MNDTVDQQKKILETLVPVAMELDYPLYVYDHTTRKLQAVEKGKIVAAQVDQNMSPYLNDEKTFCSYFTEGNDLMTMFFLRVTTEQGRFIIIVKDDKQPIRLNKLFVRMMKMLKSTLDTGAVGAAKPLVIEGNSPDEREEKISFLELKVDELNKLLERKTRDYEEQIVRLKSGTPDGVLEKEWALEKEGLLEELVFLRGQLEKDNREFNEERVALIAERDNYKAQLKSSGSGNAPSEVKSGITTDEEHAKLLKDRDKYKDLYENLLKGSKTIVSKGFEIDYSAEPDNSPSSSEQLAQLKREKDEAVKELKKLRAQMDERGLDAGAGAGADADEELKARIRQLEDEKAATVAEANDLMHRILEMEDFSTHIANLEKQVRTLEKDKQKAMDEAEGIKTMMMRMGFNENAPADTTELTEKENTKLKGYERKLKKLTEKNAIYEEQIGALQTEKAAYDRLKTEAAELEKARDEAIAAKARLNDEITRLSRELAAEKERRIELAIRLDEELDKAEKIQPRNEGEAQIMLRVAEGEIAALKGELTESNRKMDRLNKEMQVQNFTREAKNLEDSEREELLKRIYERTNALEQENLHLKNSLAGSEEFENAVRELSRAKQKLADMTNMLGEYRLELDTNKSSYNTELDSKLAELGVLRSENEALQSKIKGSSENYDYLLAEQARIKDELSAKLAQIDELKAEIGTLKGKISVGDESSKRLQTEQTHIKEELSIKLAQIDALKTENEILKARSADSAKSSEQLLTEQARIREELSAKLAEIDTLKGKIAAGAESSERLQAEQTSIKEELATNLAHIDELKAENDALKTTIAANAENSEQLLTEQSRIQDNLATKLAQMDMLRAENENLRVRVASNTKSSDQLLTEQAHIKDELSAKLAQIDELKAEIDTLKGKIAAGAESSEQLQTEQAHIKYELSAKQAQIDELKAENDALKSKIAANTENSEQLLTEQSRIQDNLATKLAQMDMLRAENENLRVRMASNTESSDQLLREQARIRAELSLKLTETDRLRAENEALKAQLTNGSENSEQKLADQALVIDELTQQLMQLTEEIKAYSKHHSDLQNALSEKENQMNNLHADMQASIKSMETLTGQKEKLINLFNGLFLPVFSMNTKYEIQNANKALLDFAKLTDLDDTQKVPCYKAVYGLDEPCRWCRMKQVAASGKDETVSVELGGKALELTFATVYDQWGEIGGISESIVDRSEPQPSTAGGKSEGSGSLEEYKNLQKSYEDLNLEHEQVMIKNSKMLKVIEKLMNEDKARELLTVRAELLDVRNKLSHSTAMIKNYKYQLDEQLIRYSDLNRRTFLQMERLLNIIKNKSDLRNDEAAGVLNFLSREFEFVKKYLIDSQKRKVLADSHEDSRGLKSIQEKRLEEKFASRGEDTDY